MEPAVPKNKSRWRRRALLGSAFVAPFLAVYLSRTNLLIALAPIFISHLLLFYATFVPNCQWWGPVTRSYPETPRSPRALQRPRNLLCCRETCRRISAPHYRNPWSRSPNRESHLH